MNCGDYAIDMQRRLLLRLHNNSPAAPGELVGVLRDKLCVYTFVPRRYVGTEWVDYALPEGATFLATVKALDKQDEDTQLAQAESVTLSVDRKLVTVVISFTSPNLAAEWDEIGTAKAVDLAFELEMTETGGAETSILKTTMRFVHDTHTGSETLVESGAEYWTKTQADARFIPQAGSGSPVRYVDGVWQVQHPGTLDWHEMKPAVVGGILVLLVDQEAVA